MKLLLKILTFIIALASSVGIANASWTPSLRVVDIIIIGPDDAAGFMVVFDQSVGVTEGTGTCQSTYHYFTASTKKGELMFSTLLSAKISNQPVRAVLVQAGSVNNCVVRDIRIQ